MTHIAPAFREGSFHCPHCNVLAHMQWGQLQHHAGIGYTDMWISRCFHCKELAFWLDGILLHPSNTTAPPPAVDMPESCRVDYEEARAIAATSPRGAAALLRLVVQKLCIELGQSGKNINSDIKALVLSGLPVDAQKALDVLRVTGNNAVHPGVLDVDANPQLVVASFGLINFIVQQQISQKKHVAALFHGLPVGAKDAIAQRDASALGSLQAAPADPGKV